MPLKRKDMLNTKITITSCLSRNNHYIPFEKQSIVCKHLSPLYMHKRIFCVKFSGICPSVSGEDFQISSCIFAILLLIPVEKTIVTLNLTKLQFPQRMLCVKFSWNWLSSSQYLTFQISSMSLHFFVIITHWINASPVIWSNFNSIHPRLICVKFTWGISPVVLERKLFFYILLMYFNYFVLIFPWKWEVGCLLKKLEFQSPKDNSSQVWLQSVSFVQEEIWKVNRRTTGH